MTWDEKIKDFEHFLKFERNFSDNTLDAYLRDIRKLRDYAEFELENVGPLEITYENIQEYLFQLSKKKFSERTQARWISSSLRRMVFSALRCVSFASCCVMVLAPSANVPFLMLLRSAPKIR